MAKKNAVAVQVAYCYLCAKPAKNPLALKDSFTAHSLAKCPTSQHLCDRCYDAIDGDEKLLWYWNQGKDKWSKLWGRSLSRLYQGDVLLSPVIGEPKTIGKDTFPVVSDLPTRAQIRSWILEPPEPPFTIVIAESGQKHILPWAQDGYSQNQFPVQFELDSLWIDRERFTNLLMAYEGLMALGFSKTEIDTGKYHSDRLMRSISQYWPLEDQITLVRGSRLMELLSHVAQNQDKD